MPAQGWQRDPRWARNLYLFRSLLTVENFNRSVKWLDVGDEPQAAAWRTGDVVAVVVVVHPPYR